MKRNQNLSGKNKEFDRLTFLLSFSLLFCLHKFINRKNSLFIKNRKQKSEPLNICNAMQCNVIIDESESRNNKQQTKYKQRSKNKININENNEKKS